MNNNQVMSSQYVGQSHFHRNEFKKETANKHIVFYGIMPFLFLHTPKSTNKFSRPLSQGGHLKTGTSYSNQPQH